MKTIFRGFFATIALVAGITLSSLGAETAMADEVCRFSGTTDYDGYAAVTTDVAATGGGDIRVDVTIAFSATRMFWFHIQYLVEELSLWHGGALQRLSVNNRYIFDDRIVRQQWDDFRRGPGGLEAWRVQSKHLDEFRQKHPGFVRHWDPAAFGQPWLGDYAAAAPERRPDLDLTSSLPATLKSPFATAFYWVRWLGRGGGEFSVFLPGFKTDKLVSLPIAPNTFADGSSWRVPLRYIALSDWPESTATAWISPDRHLRQLAFDLHGASGSARGLIRQQGCVGDAVPPADHP
jgi:hypothetical protein